MNKYKLERFNENPIIVYFHYKGETSDNPSTDKRNISYSL